MDLRNQLPLLLEKIFGLCQAKTFLSPFLSKRSNIFKKVNFFNASQTEMNLNLLSEIALSVHIKEAWIVNKLSFLLFRHLLVRLV